MEDINFVNMYRYQAIEKVVYQKVKEWKPKTIVELGHGSGALTVAMGLALKEIDIKGKDLNIAHKRVTEMCEKLLANTVIESYLVEIKK